MTTINTYLHFNGNCEEAFTFYKSIFGGEYDHLGRFKDMPDNPKYPIPESAKEKIMHLSYPISKGSILMGSDMGGEWSSKYKEGNNFSISINADTKAEADRLFEALSKEGTVTMPMEKTFWGSYFGSFIDKFGISWIISFYDTTSHK
jgi:PhnB protein